MYILLGHLKTLTEKRPDFFRSIGSNVKGKRLMDKGTRQRVTGFPNPIFDIALSPWP
jgi:hypothetical protein